MKEHREVNALFGYLDGGSMGKGYAFGETEMQKVDKKFVQRDRDEKLFALASDVVGVVSDCYIIYAVAVLGLADRASIQNLLASLHCLNPNLAVCDYEDADAIKSRLAALCKYGFLYVITFNYESNCSEWSELDSTIKLYSCSKDAVAFARKKLDKPFKSADWIQAMRESEMLAWAAASKVAAEICRCKTFKGIEGGYFYNIITKDLMQFPAEITMENSDKSMLVGVLNSVTHYDKSIMTKKDYDSYIVAKLNFIKCYIKYRSEKHDVYLVMAAASSKLAYKICEYIDKVNFDEAVLSHLYISGVGMACSGQSLDPLFVGFTKERGELLIERKTPPFIG